MMKGLCDVCRTNAELKSCVNSIKHNHETASSAQSIIIANVSFSFVDSDKKPLICEKCQKDVITGMSSGANFD